ncbi:hypothetical protein [Psychrobacter sp. Ps2]|uniref:hypothetical protein n=1 Tax=Psychrobacter sp. Ps2 TaxID=2790956 RepID=UPI001EDFD329|nr:hypothetical protein [Psychrobacter sp. Ps2]MCG3858828.1 hypothetical protein [Psychrobacter sp. Ps2]
MMTLTTPVANKPSALSLSNTQSSNTQLTDIHECLHQHFTIHQNDGTSTNDDSLAQLAHLLSQHCHLDNMIALLSSIIHSPILLKQIAARSYWHGNGFLKVVLLDQGYKLRLHIWFAGTSCEENIHSHRWGFASHVLTGSLKSELWTDAANDDSTALPYISELPLDDSHTPTLLSDEYLYTAKHQANETHVAAHKQYVGTAHLKKLQNVIQTAGASYVMTPDQLHRINHPGEELVATVICTTPTQVLTNRLFPTTADPKLHPTALSANELKHALVRYLNQQRLAA